MLDPDQVDELGRRGIVRLAAFVPPATAAAVADDVWRLLARRGVERSDPTTWPSGFASHLQALRQADVYAPFTGDGIDSVNDQLIGAGRWWHNGRPQALISFPEHGRWVVPNRGWHLDVLARADGEALPATRFLGLVEAVAPGAGATVVVEGSHELVRRLAASAPGQAPRRSPEVRKELARRHPWFAELFSSEREVDRVGLMEPIDVDGVEVRVTELTGAGGDVWVMHPWTLHSIAPHAGTLIRSMWSHTSLRVDASTEHRH